MRVHPLVTDFSWIIYSQLLHGIPTVSVAPGWLDQPLLMLDPTPRLSIRSKMAVPLLHYFS